VRKEAPTGAVELRQGQEGRGSAGLCGDRTRERAVNKRG